MFASDRLRQRGGGGAGLPITGGSAGLPAYGGAFQFKPNSNDGSGRAIQMESPIRRAWRTASEYTKWTYYVLVGALLLTVLGFWQLRRTNASVWLTCHAQGCHLEITPPAKRTTKFKFARTQLIKSQAIKVDRKGNFIKVDTSPGYRKQTKKGRKNANYSGPDEEGNYDSYTLVLRPPESNPYEADAADRDETDEEHPEVALDPLIPFTYKEENSQNRVLQMRLFTIGQSRRRARSMVTKIESYILKKRQKLVIKENASLSWQGLLAMIFGLFISILTCLIGQFADPDDPRRGVHYGSGSSKNRSKGVRQPPKSPAVSRGVNNRSGVPSYKPTGNRYSAMAKHNHAAKRY